MSIKFYKNGESKYKYSKYLGITDIYNKCQYTCTYDTYLSEVCIHATKFK